VDNCDVTRHLLVDLHSVLLPRLARPGDSISPAFALRGYGGQALCGFAATAAKGLDTV